MSMIGKLRQVSEFELAKFKKNPGEIVRMLASSVSLGDPQAYANLRGVLEQSPAMQRMAELRRQGMPPTREQLMEMQGELARVLKQVGGLRAVLSGTGAAPKPGPSEQPGAAELDLHKCWHCLHFLFTGRAEGSDGSPLGDAILGGKEIGGEAADTGYGPPRALSPGEVKGVAAALQAFPIEQRAEQFDVAAAEKAGIYVPQHGAEELKDYFLQLRSFYRDAASKGNAVLLWIE